MKTLFLVRHAKSSWEDSDMDDFERPLNNRGERDAPTMGKRLLKKGVLPEVVCSSPATRALTTALLIAKAIGFPPDAIRQEKRLYHASEETLLDLVRRVKEPAVHVMMVGHNPGLTSFANSLGDLNIDNIPTTGVVALSFDIKEWKDAKWGCGKLLFFDYPKKN